MTRKQGLALVELFFGPKKLDLQRYTDEMTFDVPTRSLVDNKEKTFNLLKLLQVYWNDPDLQDIGLSKGDKQFGEEANQETDLLTDQDKATAIEYAKPILELMHSNLDPLHAKCEDRLLYKTIGKNEAIAKNYKVRMIAWNTFKQRLPCILTEDKEQYKFDIANIIPHIIEQKKPEELRLFWQLNDSKMSDIEKLDIIRTKTREAVAGYNKFNRKHLQLLNQLVGNVDFEGNEWGTIPDSRITNILPMIDKRIDDAKKHMDDDVQRIVEQLSSVVTTKNDLSEFSKHIDDAVQRVEQLSTVASTKNDPCDFSKIDTCWKVKKQTHQLWKLKDVPLAKALSIIAFSKEARLINYKFPTYNEAKNIFKNDEGKKLCSRETYETTTYRINKKIENS